VRELIVANFERLVSRVVGGNEIVIIGEVLQQVDEVFTRRGRSGVLTQPVEELLFVVRTIMKIGRSGSKLKMPPRIKINQRKKFGISIYRTTAKTRPKRNIF